MSEAVKHLLLVEDRIYFELDLTERYSKFILNKLENAEREEQEEQDRRDQALLDLLGDNFETGMDVADALERQGGSPDFPDVPFSPLHTSFPRAAMYSCAMLACIVFEDETRTLCDAIAKWKGVS